MPRRIALPIPLLIGCVLGIYGTITYSVTSFSGGGDVERWELFHYGCALAQQVLMSYAMFALAARVRGVNRVAFHGAGWLLLAIVGWSITRPVLQVALDRDDLWITLRWGNVVSGFVYLAATLAITVATGAWRRAPVFAVLAIISVLATGLTPYLGEKLVLFLWEDHRTLFHLYWPVREIVWAGCIVVMVTKLGNQIAPPLPDVARAMTGLRRLAAATILGIAATIMVAAIALADVSSMIELMRFGGPGVIALALLARAWGILAIEEGRLEQMPRVRLACGAAFITWFAGVQIVQLSTLYGTTVGTEWMPYGEQWTIIGPLVGMVGLALVGSAISEFAMAHGFLRLRESAYRRTALYVVLTLVGGAIHLILDAESRAAGNRALYAVLATGCGVAGLIAMSGLFSLATTALASTPVLPTARVR